MRQKRALVMIFVVMMMTAMSTILLAVVDFGRMATYKEKQLERDAKWRYTVDAAKAYAVQNLLDTSTYSLSTNYTFNGMSVAVTGALDTWNSPYGYKMTVSGILDGKTKSSTVYMGKRMTMNPCQFGFFVTSKYQPSANITLAGDLYSCASTFTGSKTSITGDVYSNASTSPSFPLLTGSFIGRQPSYAFNLNNAAYAAVADITDSGGGTLTDPINLLSLSHSQLHYHTGDYTIQGTVTGEITVYVVGNVNIQNVVPVTSILSRLVVIATGNVNVNQGVNGLFIICAGKVTINGSAISVFTGSVAGSEISVGGSTLSVIWDNYFVANQSGGARYRIPGQW